MIQIIGQELDLRIRPPSEHGECRILDGIGLIWPEYYPQLACWTGIGPHSIGALRPPVEVKETDLMACGADWFLPFLAQLKIVNSVSLNEIEATHISTFGQPMLQINDHDVFLAKFYRLLSTGGKPESFFPCCRVVRTNWDKAAQIWQIVSDKGRNI